MAHPQNSPRGLFSKQEQIVPAGDGIIFKSYSATTPLLTANSTGLVVAGGIGYTGGAVSFTGNSTAVIFPVGVEVSNQAASLITGDASGIILAGRIKIGNQANAALSGSTTGVKAVGAVMVSNQGSVGKLSANSTALVLPNSVQVGALASYITANSTGIKIGNRYISTNTTGNSIT